jgi:hypothetical protein
MIRLKRWRAVPKVKSASSGVAAVIALSPDGCVAGVIMPDGSIVRGQGEPPPAQAHSWYRPSP